MWIWFWFKLWWSFTECVPRVITTNGKDLISRDRYSLWITQILVKLFLVAVVARQVIFGYQTRALILLLGYCLLWNLCFSWMPILHFKFSLLLADERTVIVSPPLYCTIIKLTKQEYILNVQCIYFVSLQIKKCNRISAKKESTQGSTSF